MRHLLPLALVVACGAPPKPDPDTDAAHTDVGDTVVPSESDDVVDSEVADTEVGVDTDTDVAVDTDNDVVDTVVADTVVADSDTDAAVDTVVADSDTDVPSPEIVTTCPPLRAPTGVAHHLGTASPGRWSDWDTGDTDPRPVFAGERFVVDDAGYAALAAELDTTLPTADLALGPVFVRWARQDGCMLGGWWDGTWYADEGVLVMSWEDPSFQCGFECDAFGRFIDAWQLPGATAPVTFCTSVTVTGRCEDSGW